MPVSSPASSKTAHPGCLVLFGLVFVLFGGLFTAIFLIVPLHDEGLAATWVETPCTILSSQVATNTDSDGDTYRVDARYRYTWLERTYESDRYAFITWYDSDRAEKVAAVARIPPGSATACFVDPQDPAQAVLVRDAAADTWVGWLTLIFPAVGLLIMAVGIAQWRTRLRTGRRAAGLAANLASSPALAAPATAADDGLPIEFGSTRSRIGKLVGVSVFALIWNGMVWTIIVLAILPDVRAGSWFAILPLLFVGIFAIIGLVVLGMAVYQALALLNPSVVVTVSPGRPAVGGRLRLRWTLSGRTERITSLSIALVCTEHATYKRGTNTSTDRHEARRIMVIDQADSAAIASGDADVVLPVDAVPSFAASHNRLVWTIAVHGDIPKWPDIQESWEIPVLPGTSLAPAPAEQPPVDGIGTGLRIHLDRSAYAPGDRITGVLAWDMAQPPGEIEVRLFWRTVGKGTDDIGITATVSIPAETAAGDRRFTFDLPSGPLSYDGTLVSVRWAVEAVVGEVAALAEIVVGPGGQAVTGALPHGEPAQQSALMIGGT